MPHLCPHTAITLACLDRLRHAFLFGEWSHIATVAKRDTSQEAFRQVEQVTDSMPVRGEALLRS